MALATASTTPPTPPGPKSATDAPRDAGAVGANRTGRRDPRAPDRVAGEVHDERPRDFVAPHTGSLTWRMIAISAVWIMVLLLGGGLTLDRTLTNLVQGNFDTQLNNNLTALIASAEIQPGGEVWLTRPMGDQRFMEPNSGLYYQISPAGEPVNLNDVDVLPSRSLWDEALKLRASVEDQPVFYDSEQFRGEPLRIAQRDTTLPGRDTVWTFAVAQSRTEIDGQIDRIRRILIISFVILGLGLLVLVLLQSYVGLRPLRRIRTAIQHIRTSGSNRVTDPLPLQGAVALFQLRDIEETGYPRPDFAAIDYAAYYMAGGRNISVCPFTHLIIQRPRNT